MARYAFYMVSLIAAIGKNREIGCDSKLLWRIPDDLKRFRALTVGHPVVMGRKTFESIGRPLPDRTNIVVTRDKKWRAEGVAVAHSLEEAIEKAKGPDSRGDALTQGHQGVASKNPAAHTIFIIGGAQIYEAALPLADKLYLTLIDDSKPADTFFPTYEKIFTKKIFEEKREWNNLKYQWVDLER